MNAGLLHAARGLFGEMSGIGQHPRCDRMHIAAELGFLVHELAPGFKGTPDAAVTKSGALRGGQNLKIRCNSTTRTHQVRPSEVRMVPRGPTIIVWAG